MFVKQTKQLYRRDQLNAVEGGMLDIVDNVEQFTACVGPMLIPGGAIFISMRMRCSLKVN